MINVIVICREILHANYIRRNRVHIIHYDKPPFPLDQEEGDSSGKRRLTQYKTEIFLVLSKPSAPAIFPTPL